ncbi:hypothetical protein EJB05_26583, partial [Eragrostis curvula]
MSLADHSSAAAAGDSTSAFVSDTITGWHVLKIDNSATKGLGVGNSIDTDPFTTAGQRWYIQYFPDGFDNDNADWVSFYLFYDPKHGEDDEVRARFTFSLLDLCVVTVVKAASTPKQFVIVPPSDLHRDLECLLSSGEGADVTFEVSGELFKAHRNVLAARSSVFRAQLFGSMKEKTAQCVQISDMEAQVFRALLDFMYTDSLPAVGAGEEIAMAQHLLVAADRYDLKRLKLICDDKLCRHIDKSTVSTTLVLAEQHSCHGLKEACTEFLLSPGILKDVMETDGYDHLMKSCPSLVDELVAVLSTIRAQAKMSPAAICGGSTSSIVSDTETGWHVLKVECYSALKGLGVGKFVESSAFDAGGHRWYIKYYPDGYDQKYKDCISFYLCADNYPDVEVRARFKISLLDPNSMTDSDYVTDQYEVAQIFNCSQSWGYEEYFEREEFEKTKYLKDDCFIVRCEVIVIKDVSATATEQFIVMPPSGLHQDLGRLLSSGEGADVTFEVSDGLFKAHRNILASRSPVFRAELFGSMKDKTMERVVISDMEARVFEALLHFVYTDSLPAFGKEEQAVMAQNLFIAADRYDLKRLKLICEDRLCHNIDRSTVMATLTLAEQHGCQGLKEACVMFLVTPGILKDMMGTDEYDRLRKNRPSLVDELVVELAPKRIRLWSNKISLRF